MAIERRRNRSEVPQEALCLYLDSMAARSSLYAVALASDEGLLLAASQSEYDSDGLAAISVARDQCVPMGTETVESILRGQQLRSSSLHIHGEKLYLAWLGARSPSVEEAVTALQRILGPVLGRARSGSHGLLPH